MATPAASVPRSGVHYAWIVTGVCFATILIAAGIRSAPSVLIHPLEQDFGWNRAAISAAVGLNLLVYGVAAPLSGWLLDRYGPRLVMISSLLLLALGTAGTLFMTELWQLVLLWGVVVGLGSGGGASVIGATVANRWFVKHRGLVLGLLNSGVSTGQLIFLPVLMVIIVNSGWRYGSVLMLSASLAAVVVVALWMRNDPADVGLTPYGADGTAAAGLAEGDPGRPGVAAGASAPLTPILTALRSPVFWLLAGSFFVCGATSSGLVGTHLVPHSIDHGFPEVTAATTVGIMGFMNFIGVLFSGWLTDRMDPRKILAAAYFLRGMSLFALPFIGDSLGLFAFATLYGLDWFATVPPIIAMTSDAFGKRSVGTIFGFIFLSHQLGSASAAVGSGALRVWLGDYQAAFLIGGTVALIGAALAMTIPQQRQQAAAVLPEAAG